MPEPITIEKTELPSDTEVPTSAEEELNLQTTEIDNELKTLTEEIAEISSVNVTEEKNKAETVPLPHKIRRRPYLIGSLSMGLWLIIMGIVLCFGMTSAGNILTAIKIAPSLLIFLGIELLIIRFLKKGAKPVFDIRSLTFCICVVVASSLMFILASYFTENNVDREIAQRRIEGQLNEILYNEFEDYPYVAQVETEITLNGEDIVDYHNLSDLQNYDQINVNIILAEVPEYVTEFAEKCEKLLIHLNTMEFNIKSASFTAEDEYNSMALNINGRFEMSFNVNQLSSMVTYYGENFEVDVPDLSEDELTEIEEAEKNGENDDDGLITTVISDDKPLSAENTNDDES